MKKYNVKENRPELTDANVELGMDFNKIKAKASAGAKLFSAKNLAITSICITAIISLLMFINRNSNNDSSSRNQLVQLPNNENIPDSFLVNSQRDTTLIHSSGSQIKIPAGAFVDGNGKEIKGQIKINYLEYHNLGEIILSNIPMNYDSAGKEMYFESAGMFKISGSQNNKPIFIRSDKCLSISLASLDETQNKFNKYYLDENSKKWNFVGRDEPVLYKDPKTNPVINMAKVDSAKLRSVTIAQNARLFTVDAEGRPDLEIYNNITFEVTEGSKTFNPEESKVQWYMVDFEKLDKTENYKVTFSYPQTGPNRTYVVIARPLKDKNMDKAIEKYDAAYKKLRQQLTNKEKSREDSLGKEVKQYQDVFEKYQALQKKNAELYARQVAQVSEASQVVYRTFQIKQFGIWNSDCPQSMPQGVEIFVNFENTSGEKLNISAVYLVEKGKNALYNLYVPRKLSFNPSSENVLLVITSSGKFGWVKNDVFESIGKDKKTFTFKLNIMEQQEYKSADINNILI